MEKLCIALISAMLIVSCGARKATVVKEDVKITIDSAVVVKVDGTYVKENNVVIDESVDEVEYVAADTSKPMIINGKHYVNTIIKSKKQKKKTVDNTKVTKKVSSVKKLNVKRKDTKKVTNKKVERKANYFMYLWLLIPVACIWLLEKYGKIMFPFLNNFK